MNERTREEFFELARRIKANPDLSDSLGDSIRDIVERETHRNSRSEIGLTLSTDEISSIRRAFQRLPVLDWQKESIMRWDVQITPEEIVRSLDAYGSLLRVQNARARRAFEVVEALGELNRNYAEFMAKETKE